MDLQYLLFLQNLREATGNVLTPFMTFVTDFIFTWVPLYCLAIFYWVFNKQAGGWMIMNWGIASWLNGISKLTACVYRPWIRDAAIIPAGDAIKTATGYSFPSGHSTAATVMYGSAGVFCKRHKKKLLAVLFFLATFLTMFSRNYLGVHTPQDVVCGFLFTMVVVVGNIRLFRWMQEGDSRRDLYVLLGGLAIMALSLVYINVKSYPMDYVNGVLLVNPEKMKIDTVVCICTMTAVLVSWFVEKRFIGFENPSDKLKGVLIGTICFIPVILWHIYFSGAVHGVLPHWAAKALKESLPFLYIGVVVPGILKAVLKR